MKRFAPKFAYKSIFKTSGIARRWLLNVFTIVAAAVLVTVIAVSSVFINSVYKTVSETASGYAKEFSKLAAENEDEFAQSAVFMAEEFAFRERIEVQVFDKNGNLVATTGGEHGNLNTADFVDYANAQSSTSGYAYATMLSKNGESVMAGTTVLPDYGFGSNGSYRWVTSLKSINTYIVIVVACFFLIGIGMMAFCFFSGMYFVRSYVRPVNMITQAAGKIASGNFNDHLEIKRDDEIGELCLALNHMADELSRTEKMKNDFISSVSHELRTPLTAIKGWGETVKYCIGEDEKTVERGIDVILNEANRLSGLVEDILDFSRMQSGTLSVQLEKIDAIEILNEAAAMYTELAAKQRIDLVNIGAGVHPPVMADRNRLKQVFINIIDNAIKYSVEGGQVLISSVVEEECLRIEVSDTGVGISAKDLEHVKEKFYRANKTVPGSGIGLAVADEIIRGHNGLMFLESTEGVGTKVTIVLPVTKPDEPDEVTAVYFPPMSEEESIDDVKQANSLKEIENELTTERDEKNEQ